MSKEMEKGNVALSTSRAFKSTQRGLTVLIYCKRQMSE